MMLYMGEKYSVKYQATDICTKDTRIRRKGESVKSTTAILKIAENSYSPLPR